jgi:outer membrane protein assembly factor BamD
MAKRTLFFILILLTGVSACKFQKIRKGDTREKYDAAIKYYQKRDYYKAGLLLEEVRPLIRGQVEAEIADFYYAYCHYHQNQLSLAAHYFQRFFETFRASKYAEEARYMEVRSLYEDSPPFNLDQTNTFGAINTTQSFLNAYPNSSYFEECNKMMKKMREKLERKAYENARLYYKISNYQAAVVAFTNFQKSFPDSEFNEEVAFLRLESQYLFAKQSIETKQAERFKQATAYYDDFTEKYPSSRYARQAKNLNGRSSDPTTTKDKNKNKKEEAASEIN